VTGVPILPRFGILCASETPHFFRWAGKSVTQIVNHPALADPDEGLQLCEDIKAQLQRSLAMVQAGGETIPAQQVAARLGLDW
jgi:hypothetical protein